MRLLILVLTAIALLGSAADAETVKNGNGKWALHSAGEHNSKANTCAFTLLSCGSIVTHGGVGGERNDVYVLAIDVDGIAGTRYGICCDGPLFFYGWTKCSDFEIPTAGWPGCGEGNAQTWTAEIIGPHVTVGILDVYVYLSSQYFKMCADARVGFAEFCDGSEPSPICHQTNDPQVYGWLGFNGNSGYAPCGTPVELKSWGRVKALYQ